jgi:hypothetical protein
MDAYFDNINVICVGPREAREFLFLGNTDHVDQSLVNKYAYDMIRGLWAYPGGLIEITSSNKLKDGHHRLLAIVQCDIPQVMIVVYNVPENPERKYG